MEIKPIRNDADHDATLYEIERLWGAKGGTQEGDRLEVLVTLAEAWERAHTSIPEADPITAINFRLEQLGLTQKALVGVIGSRSRVHELMKGDRPLTLAMIRRLSSEFGLSADVLIREPRSRSDVA
jgi:HTH-type transcriptional regulator/antitoxin HigA